MRLREIIYSLKRNQAVLHYNVSTLEQIKAGILAVQETKIPIIFGVSEGERDYLNSNLVKKILDFYKDIFSPNLENLIFLNADHCKEINSAKEAINLKYDAVLFDGSALTLEENIKTTKEIIKFKDNKEILIEGEVGFLPGKSDIQKEIEVKEEYLTKIEDAEKFVQETRVDLLAISIGNIHGLTEKEPELDFFRGEQIAKIVKIPLVLHGASGLNMMKIQRCIEIGFKIIHINTEFRKIWHEELRKQLEQGSVTPYKLLEPVVEKIKEKVVYFQKSFYSF